MSPVDFECKKVICNNEGNPTSIMLDVKITKNKSSGLKGKKIKHRANGKVS